MPKWQPETKAPKRRGWYLRDYRSCRVACPECPPYSVDLYEPGRDTVRSPGFWYVQDGASVNDAAYQALPWRRIKP